MNNEELIKENILLKEELEKTKSKTIVGENPTSK